jgi:hypothetical protein
MNVPKPRCCSCCHSPDHSIRSCNSIEVNNFIKEIDTKIINFIDRLINEVIPIMRLQNTYNQTNIQIVIKTNIQSWIQYELKHTMLAVCYKFSEIFEITNNTKITTKLKIKKIKEIIIDNYLSVIIDVLHYYNGNITLTFKKYIARKIIKMIQDFNILHELEENNHQNFYHTLRNQFFYNKRLHNYQICELLNYIRNDPLFSWYYLCLSQEKRSLVIILEEIIQDFVDKKLFIHKIKITPILHIIEDTTECIMKDCSICLEDYDLKKEIKLNCGHQFCNVCIVTTIEKNIEKKKTPPCPLCRSEIKSVEIHDEDLFDEFQKIWTKV